MQNKPTTPNQTNLQKLSKAHVNADAIGAEYGITGRYVLQLAAEGKIPCLRIGKKCVRFDADAVARALGA